MPEPPAAAGDDRRARRRDLLTILGGLALPALLPAGLAELEEPPATPLPPLALPPDSPLQSLGGLLLNRRAIGFGGLSGLHIDADLTLSAISDLGYWLQAKLVLDGTGAPQGLAALRSGPLSDGLVFGLPAKLARDAESLARLPDGTWLVGFERWHRIRAYDSLDGWGRPAPTPRGLRDAPLNEGLESLAVLADGRWLLVTEGLEAGDETLLRGWVGHPGAWRPFAYRPRRGFVPTDAAPTPDGGAVLTERRFSLLEPGFRGRVVRLPAAALAAPEPETVLESETLLEASDLPEENWEGISCFPWQGRQLLAIVTDDNEFFLQQGLLLLFAFR
jgi:hypothetical protein